MNLSFVDNSLLLATFFRGNTLNQYPWTSCSDQVVTLSLFYTGDLSAEECRLRFVDRGYVGGLYDNAGELRLEIESRYLQLINLLASQPQLIEGGGDFESPADPTFTACRLTDEGLQYASNLLALFPQKPDFPNWPDGDRQTI